METIIDDIVTSRRQIISGVFALGAGGIGYMNNDGPTGVPVGPKIAGTEKRSDMITLSPVSSLVDSTQVEFVQSTEWHILGRQQQTIVRGVSSNISNSIRIQDCINALSLRRTLAESSSHVHREARELFSDLPRREYYNPEMSQISSLSSSISDKIEEWEETYNQISQTMVGIFNEEIPKDFLKIITYIVNKIDKNRLGKDIKETVSAFVEVKNSLKKTLSLQRKVYKSAEKYHFVHFHKLHKSLAEGAEPVSGRSIESGGQTWPWLNWHTIYTDLFSNSPKYSELYFTDNIGSTELGGSVSAAINFGFGTARLKDSLIELFSEISRLSGELQDFGGKVAAVATIIKTLSGIGKAVLTSDDEMFGDYGYLPTGEEQASQLKDIYSQWDNQFQDEKAKLQNQSFRLIRNTSSTEKQMPTSTPTSTPTPTPKPEVEPLDEYKIGYNTYGQVRSTIDSADKKTSDKNYDTGKGLYNKAINLANRAISHFKKAATLSADLGHREARDAALESVRYMKYEIQYCKVMIDGIEDWGAPSFFSGDEVYEERDKNGVTLTSPTIFKKHLGILN